MAKKKKAARKGKNLFSTAAKNKAFKAAKRAQHKADAKAKKAWRKALASAKRIIRKHR